ncbi:hypothetical protein [Paenibacillus montanisoli]|uniref:Uncharacterized protein n=1 Tax=Paenibacillus montanisoli TaxID=2081970 RepID=A0A328U7E9_9BACL|nr:hypothetical protein [Paenibacillus montanisoli]RAP78450.1 hypothetical protein DL346_08505 [Paenibacillus montanisoli]
MLKKPRGCGFFVRWSSKEAAGRICAYSANGQISKELFGKNVKITCNEGVFMKLIKIILLLTFLFSFLPNQAFGKTVENEITLKEALQIGVVKAKEWNRDGKLAWITSVDENKGGSRGFNGRRFNWNLVFINPERTETLILSVSEKRITNNFIHKGLNQYELVNLDDVKVDSPTLVEIAKSKLKLKPGTEWATGYHFHLRIIDEQHWSSLCCLKRC